MNVYLVEDCKNAPGRIYGVFADYDAALDYADQIADRSGNITEAAVKEYPLWYGQMMFSVTPIPGRIKRG